MKVILLEDVVGAGSAGEVVDVKNGYARNKLLPAGIAIEVNAANMKTLEHRRAKIAAKKTADKEMAQALLNQIDGKQVDFTAKAGESGKLFGSVTAHDIAVAINSEFGFEIDRRKILLDSPLKETGTHDVRYRIYPEVEATFKINIMSDGAPTLPAAPVLKDTYSDEVLERDEEEYYMAPPAAAQNDDVLTASGEDGSEAVQDSEPETEEKAEAEPEAEPESEPEAEPVAEPEAETEPEAEPVAEPEAEPVAEPEAEPESEPEAEPEAETEPEAEEEI